LGRAREAAEAEAALSRQLREQAQQEADRMAAWRAEVEPLVDAVNEKANAIQTCVREAPQRVAEALAPVTAALTDRDLVLGWLTRALASRAGSSPIGPAGPDGPSGGPGGPGGPSGGPDGPSGGPGGPSGPGGSPFDADGESGQAEAPSFGTLGEVVSPDPVPS